MEKRQNGGHRRYLVQQFVLTIEDDQERLVCHLFMANYTKEQICNQLKINRTRLSIITLRLALGLKKAGIRVWNW